MRTIAPGGATATAPPVQAPPPLAAVGDLLLLSPSVDATLAAFHESAVTDALPLTPVGHMLANANPDQFVPPTEVAGLGYEVLAPTEGIRPPTSAVGVVVPRDATLVAPVTGEIVAVEDYAMPDRVRDWRIVIAPEGRSDVQVVLRHVLTPLVAVGTTVQGGVTEIAIVRPLAHGTPVDGVSARRAALRAPVRATGDGRAPARPQRPRPGPWRRLTPPRPSRIVEPRRGWLLRWQRLRHRPPARPGVEVAPWPSTSSSPVGSPPRWARASRPPRWGACSRPADCGSCCRSSTRTSTSTPAR